jgi:hypothetical protein
MKTFGWGAALAAAVLAWAPTGPTAVSRWQSEGEGGGVARMIQPGPPDGGLWVRFEGGSSYAYRGLPRELLRALRRSRHKAAFFHRHIRGRFPGTRLPLPGDGGSGIRHRFNGSENRRIEIP